MRAEELKYLGQTLFKQKSIRPSSLGVTSRQINYWVDKKLIPYVARTQEGGKVKRILMDLSQAAWTCVIKELVGLGIPVKKLTELSKSVWEKPRIEKYADEVVQKQIQKNPKKLSNENVEILKDYLEDENVMEYLRQVINPFTDMLKYASEKEGYPCSFLYFPNSNEHIYYYGSKSLMYDMHSLFSSDTLITIPIRPILSKVLGEDFISHHKSPQYLLSKEEEIRKIIVYKEPKTVYLAYKRDNIKPIYLREQHKKRDELIQYIRQNNLKTGDHLVVQKRPEKNYKLTLISKS